MAVKKWCLSHIPHVPPLPPVCLLYIKPVNAISFEDMNIICAHCATYYWLYECLKHSLISVPQFRSCCHYGKVSLEHLPDPSECLHNLFTGQSTEAKEFREHIQQYNSMLAFISFTAKEKDISTNGCEPWVLKSGYTIYHCIANIVSHRQDNPTYA